MARRPPQIQEIEVSAALTEALRGLVGRYSLRHILRVLGRLSEQKAENIYFEKPMAAEKLMGMAEQVTALADRCDV